MYLIDLLVTGANFGPGEAYMVELKKETLRLDVSASTTAEDDSNCWTEGSSSFT